MIEFLQLDACVCRKWAVKTQQVYDDVLNGAEYATLSVHQQLIIREGLTRNMCIQKAYLIDEPKKVIEECRNYTSNL